MGRIMFRGPLIHNTSHPVRCQEDSTNRTFQVRESLEQATPRQAGGSVCNLLHFSHLLHRPESYVVMGDATDYAIYPGLGNRAQEVSLRNFHHLFGNKSLETFGTPLKYAD